MALTQEQADHNRTTLPQRKNKPTAAELMAQQAAAAQQEAPVVSWLPPKDETQENAPTSEPTTNTVTGEAASKDKQEPEEQETGKKKKKPTKNGMVLKSFYCDEAIFNQLAELAEYRSILRGKKNSRGQNIGAGTLINEAATEYLKRHLGELNQYRQLMQPVKDAVSWTYTTTAPDGTIITEDHGGEE